MADMRIAIGIDHDDRFGDCIRGIIEGEKDWPCSTGEDPSEIETQRRRLAHELFEGAELVDLVGHSTPIRCYLKLRDWVLDRAAAEKLASYLPDSVATVRLIGCNTAGTEEARAAAAALTLRRQGAYGTLNKVYSTHFDKDGVKKGIGAPPMRRFLPVDGALVTQPSADSASDRRSRALLVMLVRRSWAAIVRVYRKIRRVLPSRDDPHERISGLLDRQGSAMTGLLTEPLFVFGVASRSGMWTLEILFDFESARFYASAGAAGGRDLVYKIHGFGQFAKTPLEAYLERGPRGITLISRHEEAGNRCDGVPPRGNGGGRAGASRLALASLVGAVAVVLALLLVLFLFPGPPVPVPIDASVDGGGKSAPIPIDAPVDGGGKSVPVPIDAPVDGASTNPGDAQSSNEPPDCVTQTVTYTGYVPEYISPAVYPLKCPPSIEINRYSSAYVGGTDIPGGTFVVWADAAPATRSACEGAFVEARLKRWVSGRWMLVSSKRVHGTWKPSSGKGVCQQPRLGWSNASDATKVWFANASYMIVAAARAMPDGATRRLRVFSEMDRWNVPK